MIRNLDEILEQAQAGPPGQVAVAAADDESVLECVKSAVERGLAEFHLVGDVGRLEKMCADMGLCGPGINLVAAESVSEAARLAVGLLQSGRAGAVMKGQLPTGVFLKAVLDKDSGLRTGRLLSQCGVYDRDQGRPPMLITDCAMNIAPTLDQKAQIVQNAVDLALALGFDRPRVAALCALETVNPEMPETIEAAVLSKMAERGQIKNCLMDGPLALDNAVSPQAAAHKRIGGPVAGRADILLAPDLKTGNVLHKSLVYFSYRKNAALVLGAAAPIIMTSRTDSVETKVLSVALALLLAGREVPGGGKEAAG